ncbi:MAG: hypothetical protein ABI741_06940 [Ferruginibacter sp.]
MKIFLKYAVIFALFFKVNCLYAQDITGTWEGELGGTEYLQVNIVQVKDNICGFTWDYIYNERSSFCKAYFSGYYDRERKEWILTGTSFIANSGDHILMRLRLKNKIIDGENILMGTESDPSMMGTIFSILYRQNVYLKKVSGKPARMMANMEECLKQKQQKKDTIKIRPDTVKKFVGPVKSIDNIKKVTVPVKPIQTNRTDSLNKIKPPVVPVIIINDSSKIIKSMSDRKNKEMKRLVVNEKNITLSVYDNGIIDSDTVSIFYNGKLILSHQRLSEQPIVIPISLDEKTTTHEITLFAENLGSIPPNTALVVVNAGEKRYELYASASLTENAVIIFEYKPKL